MDKDKQILDLSTLTDGDYNLTVKNHTTTNFYRLSDRKTRRFLMICCFFGAIIMFSSFFLIFVYGSPLKTTVQTTINFDAIKEKAELTVLSVCVNKTINESRDDNGIGISASTTFTGKGTYTVDLGKSVFLVDNARHTLIIKTPRVKLDQDHFTLEYNNVKQNFFNNAGFNNSYKDGVSIAERHYKEAYASMYKTVTSNVYFYENAVNAAKNLIENFAKSINKNISDLTVIVEIGALS